MIIAFTVVSVIMPIISMLMFVIGYNIGCHTRKPMLKRKKKELSELDKQIKAINDFQGW